MKVVDKGPQAAKKKIEAYMVIHPMASDRQIGLVPSNILLRGGVRSCRLECERVSWYNKGVVPEDC